MSETVEPHLSAIWVPSEAPRELAAAVRATSASAAWDHDPGGGVAIGEDWVGLDAGTVKLELMTPEVLVRMAGLEGSIVLAFKVPDVNAALSARGLQADVQSAPWGRYAVVRASAGVLIQLFDVA